MDQLFDCPPRRRPRSDRPLDARPRRHADGRRPRSRSPSSSRARLRRGVDPRGGRSATRSWPRRCCSPRPPTSPWHRHRQHLGPRRHAMAAAHKTLTEAFPGRFLLGLGVSHQPMVDGVRGHDYDKPLADMRAYLDAMDSVALLAAEPSSHPGGCSPRSARRCSSWPRERAAGRPPVLRAGRAHRVRPRGAGRRPAAVRRSRPSCSRPTRRGPRASPAPHMAIYLGAAELHEQPQALRLRPTTTSPTAAATPRRRHRGLGRRRRRRGAGPGAPRRRRRPRLHPGARSRTTPRRPDRRMLARPLAPALVSDNRFPFGRGCRR